MEGFSNSEMKDIKKIKEQLQEKSAHPEPQYKTVYQIAANGVYIGPATLSDITGDISPLDGEWLIPAGCTEVVPPEIPDGKAAYLISNEWKVQDIPAEPETEAVLEPTLEKLKEYKKQEINTIRNAKEQSVFLFDGKTYDCDSVSVQRIAIAAQNAVVAKMIGVSFTVDWTLTDNTTVTLDADSMLKVSQALATHSANIHAIARELKAAVYDAATSEELDDVVWPEG